VDNHIVILGISAGALEEVRSERHRRDGLWKISENMEDPETSSLQVHFAFRRVRVV
jgi:hypothetical protein